MGRTGQKTATNSNARILMSSIAPAVASDTDGRVFNTYQPFVPRRGMTVFADSPTSGLPSVSVCCCAGQIEQSARPRLIMAKPPQITHGLAAWFTKGGQCKSHTMVNLTRAATISDDHVSCTRLAGTPAAVIETAMTSLIDTKLSMLDLVAVRRRHGRRGAGHRPRYCASH